MQKLLQKQTAFFWFESMMKIITCSANASCMPKNSKKLRKSEGCDNGESITSRLCANK